MLNIRQSVVQPKERKISLAQFVEEYREMYKEGQSIFTEFNPCRVKNGTCFQGRRNSKPEFYSLRAQQMDSFCCSGCQYLSETGCIGEALYCKLWVCGTIVREHPDFERMHNSLLSLRAKATKLCRYEIGRKDISDYIKMFYGQQEYDEWKITQAFTMDTSSQSAA